MKEKHRIGIEIKKLFNNLPIAEGLDAIIRASKRKFHYGKTEYLLGYSEDWWTQLEDLNCIETSADKIILELSRNSQDLENGCYHTSLRILYSDEEVMMQAFHALKVPFEALGNRIEREITRNKYYEIDHQIVMIYVEKETAIPNISFATSYSDHQKYQLFINCSNCL